MKNINLNNNWHEKHTYTVISKHLIAIYKIIEQHSGN